MERWQAERVKNLQEEIEQLEYDIDLVNDAEGYELDIFTGHGELSIYYLEEHENDKIRDILLGAMNRQIIRLEKELGDI